MAQPQNKSQAVDSAMPSTALSIVVLKKRSDFVKAARGQKVVRPGFILQARQRFQDADPQVRVGFTTSKKVGHAVARNHARRRLREIARQVLPFQARPHYDYVLIGRAEATARLPFNVLKSDLESALRHLHKDHQA